ncbi:MAG: hypothetical protein FWE98_07160 [Oscillospiraceae bacterium]|nr:hypothetical protein [Oscillospiraceae bacterium]
MKTTKRLLATLLALALGLAALAPMAFAAAEEGGLYAPYITKQARVEKTYVQLGKNLQLEVEARLPNGIEGTLSYAWYVKVPVGDGFEDKLIATEAKATVLVTQEMLGNPSTLQTSTSCYVIVTNIYTDEAGQAKEAYTKSSTSQGITLFPGYSVIPEVTKALRTWPPPLSYFFPFLVLPALLWTVFLQTYLIFAALFFR